MEDNAKNASKEEVELMLHVADILDKSELTVVQKVGILTIVANLIQQEGECDGCSNDSVSDT